jgi:divalent metal cation (Fe/Co/Zn/Cd) transporter
VLRSAVREVLGRVLDSVDPSVVDRAARAVCGVPEVAAVSELRIRWIGRALRAEVAVEVDPTLTLAQAHEVAQHAEGHLLDQVPHLRAALISVSPSSPTRAALQSTG